MALDRTGGVVRRGGSVLSLIKSRTRNYKHTFWSILGWSTMMGICDIYINVYIHENGKKKNPFSFFLSFSNS